MVFGNMGDDCATGVAFTRNPSTGANEFYGEYLVNAQGEDVVAGIRTPQHLTVAGKKANRSNLPAMEEVMPKLFGELDAVRRKLESHYRDMQDIEFTVQQGRLWMLQTRSGKRTAAAALKIAVDMVSEGLIDKRQAMRRDRSVLARPAAASDPRSEGAAQGDRPRPAGLAGCCGGQGGVHRRRGRGSRHQGREGHPGAARDQPGRHPRHACRRRAS